MVNKIHRRYFVRIESIYLLVGLMLLFFSGSAFSTSSHNTKGYSKRNGTYVAPHRQANPNSTQRDNWSSKGNSNPYTGKKGTKEPTK